MKALNFHIGWKNWVLPVVLLLGYVGFQLYRIQTVPLSNDEVFSIYHAQMDNGSIIKELSKGNNPPLFELILHQWIKLGGIGSMYVRILSLIFSILTLFTLYRFSKEFKSENLAIWAVLFLGISNVYGQLAIEARAYSLMFLLLSVSLFCLQRFVKTGNFWFALGWSSAEVLACYAHFFALWVGIAVVIAFLFWNRSQFKKLGGAIIIGALMYLPYLPILWHRFFNTANEGTWLTPAPFDAPYFTLWKFTNSPLVAIASFILLIWATFEAFKPKSSMVIKIVVLWFWLPFIGMYVLSLNHPFSIPMFTDRYVSFVMPALFIGIIYVLLKFHWVYRTLLMVLMVAGISFEKNYLDYRTVLPIVTKFQTDNPGKPIILAPSHQGLSALYYAYPNEFQKVATDSIYFVHYNQLKPYHVFTLEKGQITVIQQEVEHELGFAVLNVEQRKDDENILQKISSGFHLTRSTPVGLHARFDEYQK